MKTNLRRSGRWLFAAALLFALAAVLGGPAGAAPAPPEAVTSDPSDVMQTTAAFHGGVDPNGSATSYEFQYSTDESFASFSRNVSDVCERMTQN